MEFKPFMRLHKSLHGLECRQWVLSNEAEEVAAGEEDEDL
jgi:hypothetical protein